jgi:hypothetical protein
LERTENVHSFTLSSLPSVSVPTSKWCDCKSYSHTSWRVWSLKHIDRQQCNLFLWHSGNKLWTLTYSTHTFVLCCVKYCGRNCLQCRCTYLSLIRC